MTARLVFGCDPGITGAVAVLADGEVVALFDTPVRARKSGNDEVNLSAFVEEVRRVRALHVGAYEVAAIENVQPMPSQGAKRGMGAVSAFQYGRTVQSFYAVFELLRIPVVPVHASRWKRDVGMPTKAEVADDKQRKDYARTLAIQKYPGVADQLKTKSRGQPRAEALLIATWAHKNEVVVAEPEHDLLGAAA